MKRPVPGTGVLIYGVRALSDARTALWYACGINTSAVRSPTMKPETPIHADLRRPGLIIGRKSRDV